MEKTDRRALINDIIYISHPMIESKLILSENYPDASLSTLRKTIVINYFFIPDGDSENL